MNSAYEEGYQAFIDGKQVVDNPYSEVFDKEEHLEWFDGWSCAAEELVEEE